jgi:membrane protease YdiL (CAAX protease family)
MAGISKTRARLFGVAFLSVAGFRLGIPGLADLIEGIWGEAEPASRSVLPAEWQGMISILSLVVFGVVLYLNYKVFFKGAKKGRRGLLIVVCGFLAGIVVASACLLVFINQIFN